MSVNRQILALSIPSIIANITTPLLGLVDTAITGHMGSAVFLAAIALGGSVFNLLYWCFSFLRAGTSGMTAQEYGAGGATLPILRQGLLVSAILGGFMIIFGGFIASGVLSFMDAYGEVRDLAAGYVSVAIWGAPAVLANYALAGWFIGMQDSRSPMVISILINVVNIALSLLLVFGCGLGVKGLGAGTMIAQWLGAALGLLIVYLKYGFKAIGKPPRESGRLSFKSFFKINADIFLRTLCLVAVTLWFTRAGSRQGDVILAVNALIMQLFMLLSYFMDGFAYAGEALVGKFIGARDAARLRLAVRALLWWGIGVSTLFTALYAIGGQWFLGLLSSDAGVISASEDYFWWGLTLPFAGFGAFIWDGVFIGATRTREMLLSMVSAMGVFFGLYLILPPAMGNHRLWVAFVSYLLMRGVMLFMLWILKRERYS